MSASVTDLDALLSLKLQHLSPALFHIRPFCSQKRSQRLPQKKYARTKHAACEWRVRVRVSHRQGATPVSQADADTMVNAAAYALAAVGK